MIARAPISGVLPLYRSLVRSPPGKGKETAATQLGGEDPGTHRSQGPLSTSRK